MQRLSKGVPLYPRINYRMAKFQEIIYSWSRLWSMYHMIGLSLLVWGSFLFQYHDLQEFWPIASICWVKIYGFIVSVLPAFWKSTWAECRYCPCSSNQCFSLSFRHPILCVINENPNTPRGGDRLANAIFNILFCKTSEQQRPIKAFVVESLHWMVIFFEVQNTGRPILQSNSMWQVTSAFLSYLLRNFRIPRQP